VSISVTNRNGMIEAHYDCDYCDEDGFDQCDRSVTGSIRMLRQPPTDWSVVHKYGTLQIYCPAHKPVNR
jgi:hypothetical protein